MKIDVNKEIVTGIIFIILMTSLKQTITIQSISIYIFVRIMWEIMIKEVNRR